MRLRKVGELVVLHDRSPTPEPRQVETTNFTEDGKQWLFLCLVGPSDLSAVRTREVAAQGYWRSRIQITLTFPFSLLPGICSISTS